MKRCDELWLGVARPGVPPRVAALHDLSCLGRCALTAVIPVLSAMGVQAVPVPTALLSTQTDGFEGLFFRDLSQEMDGITAHFDRLALSFDAIYSGFLGSEGQIRRVIEFADRFGGGGPVLVDPVMGDDGALYQTYTPQLAEGMKELCRHAHILTPNYTEACYLTDTPYRPESELGEEALMALCDDLGRRLCAMGPRRVVITGLHTGDKVRTVAYDGAERFVCDRPRLAARFPGTGDIFASVLLGGILQNTPFREAVARACAFVCEAIRATLAVTPTPPRREGVLLEACLGALLRKREPLTDE